MPCLCTVTDFSDEERLAESNFARWFIGILAGNSTFWGTLLPQKPKVGAWRVDVGSECVTHSNRQFHALPVFVMAAIIYFVSIDERPAVGSQPNWPVGRKWCRLKNAPEKFRGPCPQIWGASKNIKFWTTFYTTSTLDRGVQT